MRRGGYSGDKRFELKFRADPVLYQTLKTISEKHGEALALVIRELVTEALGQKRDKPKVIS